MAESIAGLQCSHGNNVLACSACNELVPPSFWQRMSWNRFSRETNIFHVTELTDCLARAYLERTSPRPESVESAWAKLRGSLLHYLTRSLGWSELRLETRLELEGAPVKIVGYIDAYEPQTATIYDLKTSRFVSWQDQKGFIPRESHVAQVQCYYTMLREYSIPVRRLVLIYVDDKSIIPKQVPLEIRKEWMVRRATELYKSLTQSSLPRAEVGSICKFCPHEKLCPKSDRILPMEETVRRLGITSF